MGETIFFDVMNAPPKNRRPTAEEVFTYEQLIEEITNTYDQRNDPSFVWAD